MPRDVMGVRFSDEERAYIERRMKAESFASVGDYLRYAVLVEGVMAGDGEAWKVLRQRVQVRARSRLAALMESLREASAS
jgi:hypothetical protein